MLNRDDAIITWLKFFEKYGDFQGACKGFWLKNWQLKYRLLAALPAKRGQDAL